MQCPKCNAELTGIYNYCYLCGKKQITEQNEKKRNPKRRGNGQGSVYKQGKTWTAEVVKYYYTDENGNRQKKIARKKGIPTKKEANNLLPTLMNKSANKVPTLDDLWRGYIPALEKLSADRQTGYKAARRKLKDIFYIPVDQLTIEDLQAAVDKNSSSHSTANDMKVVLSHLYKRAVAQRNISASLAPYITLPDLVEAEQIPFSKEEQTAIWDLYATGDAFAPYILLMIYTGMMPGELMKARKDMIDWSNQRIVGGGIKTKKRKETPIVLSDTIIPVLEKICENNEGYMLINLSKKGFYKEYYACLERAGTRKLRPYSCRHTTGTALGTSDIPIAIAKEVMRHTKITTTQKYMHPDTSDMLEAVNKIG